MDGTGNITKPAEAPKSTPPLDAKGKARLQKAVKDFEAIFLGMMMKSMQSTVPKDDASGESFGGDAMESLFDAEVAKRMAGRSNLGLAEMLYKSITKESLPAYEPPPAGSGSVKSLPLWDGPSVMSKGASTMAPEATPKATPNLAPKVAPPPAGAWTSAPSVSTRERIASYENIIQEAAQKHGVDTTMLKAVIAAESGGKKNAVSPKEAKGLMQLTDSTAADMGVRNVWNPSENIHGGAKYLQSLIQRFPDDTRSVLASYNAGPGRVEKHGGVPPIPETQAYVRRVMNYMNYFQQEEASHEGH
jgi:Rod binding domain-containing protein